MSISFIFSEAKITLPEKRRLKGFIAGLFKANRKKLGSLTYIFCSDPFLLEINKQFLKHDYYTDIITFNLAPQGKAIEGEIYISVDRVKDNAKILSLSIREELHRVIFHGALHLCGYKDKRKEEKRKMKAAEDKCLISYLQ